MSKILIQNNIIHAFELMHQASEVLYAPLFSSELQRQFHRKRFNHLKSIYPHIRWCEQVAIEEFDQAYAWDAIYEKQAFQNKLSQKQNRLFEQLPFICPNGFATFKERITPHLPEFYHNAISPLDPEIIQHLQQYFEQSLAPSNYFETRNQLLGVSYSTGISSYLSTGHLDVRFVYNCVKNYELKHGSNKSSQWIVYELLWREFFYWHYQRHDINFFSRAGIKGIKNLSPYSHYKISDLKTKQAHPFWIAALNELEQTGHLSNRARQIFASIWINDLELEWRSGAQLFQEHLLDYDVYSNWGNWMYLAGVGVDPRGKRYFDVDKQLASYDSNNEYLHRWKTV
jgi:deoxyribodipyrimidine photo-lyase